MNFEFDRASGEDVRPFEMRKFTRRTKQDAGDAQGGDGGT